MLTTKERAKLRSLANPLKPSLSFGKGELDDSFLDSAAKALKAHELIKIRVLQNSNIEPEELLMELAKRLDAEPVNKLGRVLTLYKRNEEKPKIAF